MLQSLPVILGQALLFADWHLLGYGALIWLFFHIVVIAYEGADAPPKLRSRV